MRIVCQQTILMKRRALFVFLFFEKAAKFAIVVCCKLYVALYELIFAYYCCLLITSAKSRGGHWPPLSGPLLYQMAPC